MGANGMSIQINQSMVNGRKAPAPARVEKRQYMGKQRVSRQLLDYQQRIDQKALEDFRRASRKSQNMEYLISGGIALATIVVVLGLWMFIF